MGKRFEYLVYGGIFSQRDQIIGEQSGGGGGHLQMRWGLDYVVVNLALKGKELRGMGYVIDEVQDDRNKLFQIRLAN